MILESGRLTAITAHRSSRGARCVALAMAIAAYPLVATAQGRDTASVRAALPRDVAREVVALFNATTTLRATDQVEIESGRTVAGDVAVPNWPATIPGRL